MLSNAVDKFRHSIHQKSSGGWMQVGTLNCQSRSRAAANRKLFLLLATGGSPGVIQRRGFSRRNGEINNAATESGVPRFFFTSFMFPPCGMKLY